MPSVNHTVTVSKPLAETWEFVKESDNWANLMPGYQHSEKIDDRTFRWKLKGDIGILARTVTFRVDVTEWNEGEHVRFVLSGEDEGIQGAGTFDIAAEGENETRLRFELELRATGVLGPVVNAFLEKILPSWVQQFAEGLKAKVEAAA